MSAVKNQGDNDDDVPISQLVNKKQSCDDDDIPLSALSKKQTVPCDDEDDIPLAKLIALAPPPRAASLKRPAPPVPVAVAPSVSAAKKSKVSLSSPVTKKETKASAVKAKVSTKSLQSPNSSSKTKQNSSSASKPVAGQRSKSASSSSGSVSSSSVGSGSSVPMTAATQALYESDKGRLVQALLVRWWYAVDWPPASCIIAPPKCYDSLEGFPGVYICTAGLEVGKILDNRPRDSAPCFSNLIRRPAAELKSLVGEAIEKQLNALSPAITGSGTESPGTEFSPSENAKTAALRKELTALGVSLARINADKADKQGESLLARYRKML